ncbi:MAG: hypothetical protein ACOZFS_11090 [Thermodesulfobacteriota bacterium]
MDDSITSGSARREERDLLVFELLVDLLFLATFSVLEVRFFTLLVGVDKARPGEKVNARVIAALHKNRFTIQNLLFDGTIREGTKLLF